MMWQRLKNLWYLSSLPKNGKGFPDEFERGHQAGEMHALQTRLNKAIQPMGKKSAMFIPHIKVDPVKEITEEQA